MQKRSFLLITACVLSVYIISCAAPNPTHVLPTVAAPSPTAVAQSTAMPAATPLPTSADCVACHTSKDTLEKLAVAKTEKSEATTGEG